MVGNEEELQDKMIKEIQRETDVELAHAACLAKVSERGKRNNNM
jgi:ADP-ribose pyrophosphatase YjhB (NUDIX family)